MRNKIFLLALLCLQLNIINAQSDAGASLQLVPA